MARKIEEARALAGDALRLESRCCYPWISCWKASRAGILDMPDAKAERDECPADGLAVVMRGPEPPDLHGIILGGDYEGDAAETGAGMSLGSLQT